MRPGKTHLWSMVTFVFPNPSIENTQCRLLNVSFYAGFPGGVTVTTLANMHQRKTKMTIPSFINQIGIRGNHNLQVS